MKVTDSNRLISEFSVRKKYTEDSSDDEDDDFISKPNESVDFVPSDVEDGDNAEDSFIAPPKKSKSTKRPAAVISDDEDSETPMSQESAPVSIPSSPGGVKESDGESRKWINYKDGTFAAL